MTKHYEQPMPIANNSPPIWELVIADMDARDNVGRQRYGVPLQAANGRDALRDAYEEALDQCAYIRQAIAERDAKQTSPEEPLKDAMRLLQLQSGVDIRIQGSRVRLRIFDNDTFRVGNGGIVYETDEFNSSIASAIMQAATFIKSQESPAT